MFMTQGYVYTCLYIYAKINNSNYGICPEANDVTLLGGHILVRRVYGYFYGVSLTAWVRLVGI